MPAWSRSGITVTLTTASTVYRLADLITAIDANASNRFRRLQLQSDPANASSNIYAGDSQVSANRKGYTMQPGDYGPPYDDINPSMSTLDLYLVSDTSGVKVNVDGVA